MMSENNKLLRRNYQPCLPNFLIIGTQKSGTTWLWNEMRQHPDIFMPKEKELKYFSNDSHIKYHTVNSIEWYKCYFTNCANLKKIGEATPEYLYRKNTAKNIFNTIPTSKLIVTLRQPAQRAYSQWRMLRKHRVIPLNKSFEHAFFSNKLRVRTIRKRGLYAEQLKRYFKLFPRNQILIMYYDDLILNHKLFLSKIYSFLSINSDFISKTAHLTLQPRLKFNDTVPLTIPKEDEIKITAYYKNSICELEDLLSVDLSHWKQSLL